MEIKAKKVNEFKEMINPGDILYWYDKNTEIPGGLNFICPCGCGGFGGIIFGDSGAPLNQKGSGWAWNGDLERPTVTPSILFNKTEGCAWHGYLTDGVFCSC